LRLANSDIASHSLSQPLRLDALRAALAEHSLL
jgi:hypothetical protein